MKLDKILAGIREGQSSEKTASERTAPVAVPEKTAAPRDALVGALRDALNTSEKTASAKGTGPVEDVMKVASVLAASEKEASEKEAATLGTAFADAAIARFAEWNKVAAQMPAPQADAAFGKFANENQDLLKQAAANGYSQTRAGLEKMAEDAYVQGFNDTVVAIHKTASLEFLKGAAVTARVVEALSAK